MESAFRQRRRSDVERLPISCMTRQGALFTFRAQCRSLNCPKCGYERVNQYLAHALSLWTDRQEIFVAVCGAGDDVGNRDARRRRVSKRAERVRQDNQPIGNYGSVERIGGNMHFFADVALGGEGSPKDNEWNRLSPQAALEELALALSMPGLATNLKCVIWSKGWRLPVRVSGGNKLVGYGDGVLEAAYPEAWRIASDRRCPDIGSGAVPDGWTTEQWHALVRTTFDKVKALQRRDGGEVDVAEDT
jgi:hypothetical protein